MPYLFLLPAFTKDILTLDMAHLSNLTSLPLIGQLIATLEKSSARQGLLISISGIGAVVGSLALASMTNKRRGLFLLLSVILGGGSLIIFSVTSSYLIALSETGLIGVTLFIGFFAMVTLEAFRRSASSDTTTRIFSLGILGALVAMSIHNITDVAGPHALQAMWWLYAGIAIGSAPEAKRPAASEVRAVA